jgi:hypothetical protein
MTQSSKDLSILMVTLKKNVDAKKVVEDIKSLDSEIRVKSFREKYGLCALEVPSSRIPDLASNVAAVLGVEAVEENSEKFAS